MDGCVIQSQPSLLLSTSHTLIFRYDSTSVTTQSMHFRSFEITRSLVSSSSKAAKSTTHKENTRWIGHLFYNEPFRKVSSDRTRYTQYWPTYPKWRWVHRLMYNMLGWRLRNSRGNAATRRTSARSHSSQADVKGQLRRWSAWRKYFDPRSIEWSSSEVDRLTSYAAGQSRPQLPSNNNQFNKQIRTSNNTPPILNVSRSHQTLSGLFQKVIMVFWFVHKPKLCLLQLL